MTTTGLPSHLDISAGNPSASIRFYDRLLIALGYTRQTIDALEWQGEQPNRATWALANERGVIFEVEVRPAQRPAGSTEGYDRYAPGPHHFAFQAASPEIVDAVYRSMLAIGARVLDAPSDYGGQPGYGSRYFAAFFADPDGFKVEVVCRSQT